MKEEKDFKTLVRILNTDIPGKASVYRGLISIKGVSWSVSNAICNKLLIDKNKKISDLSLEEIKKIEDILEKGDFPSFIKNRRKDLETGKDKHLVTTTLNLQTDFDIKRLKKIKSYKGIRHSLGQPVRGQRTKSHFRKNKISSGGGIKRKNKVVDGNKEKKE